MQSINFLVAGEAISIEGTAIPKETYCLGSKGISAMILLQLCDSMLNMALWKKLMNIIR